MEAFEQVFSLKGKTALITGGATGLGLAMTRCMIAAGAKVIVVSSSPAEKYQGVLAPFGDRVVYYSFNVTDTDHTEEFAKRVFAENGTVDILVNNAGNHCKKPIEEMETADFMRVLDVHLKGSFAMTRAFLPAMRAQKSGNVIFIASMTSYIGMPQVMGYSAAKSGVLGMIRALTAEVGGDGIRVNGIAPGWIDTPMLHRAVDQDIPRQQKILGRTPMKKYGEPEDIGWAAVYLCSDAAKFVTGTVIPVDGGALNGF